MALYYVCICIELVSKILYEFTSKSTQIKIKTQFFTIARTGTIQRAEKTHMN